MPVLRLQRPRSFGRIASFLVLVPFLLTSRSTALFAADRLAGVVVDQSGQPLPRVYVRTVDANGREGGNTFSDERGRFDIAPASGDRCHVEASLMGFAPASIDCAAAPLKLVLRVAPVEETVVVTATRTEAPADQVGASVTAYTEEDIASRRESLLADLIRTTPGAMLIRTGAPGGVTSLFVRGGESNYNKVLLDGIPLNEPGGTFYFNNLTTENLERVEIVRGAQSALFGSDAMSSVVQLFTKRAVPGAPTTASVGFEGGNYGTTHVDASAAGRTGVFDYSVGAAHINTDNNVPNSHFDNTTLSGTLGVAFNQTSALRVVARGELGKNGAPGQTAFQRPDLDAFGERHDGTVGISFNQQVTPRIHQLVSYAFALSNQRAADLKVDPPYVPRYGDRVAPFAFTDFLYDSRTDLRRHHATYQADVEIANDATHGRQLFTALADWDGERGTLKDQLAGTNVPASRDNIGVAIQHQATWRRVSATAGGRFEHNASFGDAFVPRGSVAVVLHEANADGAFGVTSVHAAAGKGIKEPTLLQSYSPFTFYLGNPNLQPERSRSVEVGVDQRLASDRVRVGATWFDNHYFNLISTVTTDPLTYAAQYFNIGESRARGAELSFDVAPTSSLRGRAGYTFLDSEVIASTSPFSTVLQAGQPLFRRPRHSGFVQAMWTQGRIAASFTGTFIGQYLDSDYSSLEPPLLENPGYTTWDLRASYRVTRLLTATLSIDNVANESYMPALGYQALGRAARAGFRVAF